MKFGAFNLQDPANGVWVTDTDIYSSPENNIQADNLAETDGALIVRQQYSSKPFTVSGVLRKDTIGELEQLIDTFKAAMAVKNQAFDLEYSGDIRRYLASAKSVTVARGKRLTSAVYTVSLLSPDGVGWSLDSTALLTPTGITTSSPSFAVTVLGTYACEPVTTVTLNTVTGTTNKTISISNGSSLRGISIKRNWSTGDVLEIDSLKKTVYVNNLPVEFTGQFPRWATGSQVMQYLDDFTTRDATIKASYTKRWL